MKSLVIQRAYPLWLYVLLCVIAFASFQLAFPDDNFVGFRVASAHFLLFLAPGLLLCERILPLEHRVERLLVSIGISTALSILTLYLTIMVAGTMTPATITIVLGAELLLLLIGTLFWRSYPPTKTPLPRAAQLGLLITIVFALLWRAPLLGYSELQDDEIDVANAATRVLRGDTDSLLRDRRGPAQPVLTLATMVLTDSLQEWVLRVPPLVANTAAIGLIWLLLHRIYGWQRATIAGALLALDGFYLAYARVVQMQSTLLLMMALSAYLLYLHRIYQAVKPKRAGACLVAAAFAAATGLLAHHEMAVFLPVLLWLWLGPEWSRMHPTPLSSAGMETGVETSSQPAQFFAGFTQAFGQTGTRLKDRLSRPATWAALLLFLLVSGSYYVPFILHESFTSTLSYYSDEIVGRTINGNLREYFLVGTFYNSVLYFCVVWSLVALTLVGEIYRRSSSFNQWAWLIRLLSLLLPVLVWVGMAGWWNSSALSLVLWGLFLLYILWGPGSSSPTSLFVLWLLVFFLPYSYVLRELHVHYYVYAVPLSVLATLGLVQIVVWLHNRVGTRSGLRMLMWFGGGVTAGAFLLLSGIYMWLVFVRPEPAYALTFPAHQSPLFPTPYGVRYGEAFGFPHKSGWKTIGYLYQSGQLRGNYETNELHLKAHWYTRDTLDEPQPRYYFVSTLPHRLQSAPAPQPLSDAYRHWGNVIVADDVRIKIYEHVRYWQAGAIRNFQAEDFEALYSRNRSTTWLRMQATYGADDHFYRDLARHVETGLSATASTALLFYVGQQQELFSYYYRGELPYLPVAASGPTSWSEQLSHLLEADGAVDETAHAVMWAENEDVPQRAVEEWLNSHLFKVGEEWFGNVRFLTYGVPDAPLDAAAIAQPLDVSLGSEVALLGYTVHEKLRLTLYWQATSAIERDYKVFVHLLNVQGDIIAQNDSEPVGGVRPTSSWTQLDPEEIVIDNYGLAAPEESESASYVLAVGMYDPETGERLPAFDSSGQRLDDDAVRIPVSQ